MKKIFAIGILLVLGLAAVASATVPVEVMVGKGTVITLTAPAERVSIADPSVAELMVVSPTELLLNGKRVGTTSLIAWDTRGKRTFFDLTVFGDLDTLRRQISELAPDSKVVVETAGDSIFLKGEVRRDDTAKRIGEISKAYAAKVINLIQTSSAQQVLLQVKVAQINKTKLKELGVGMLAKGEDAEGMAGTSVVPGTTDPGIGGDAGTTVTPGLEGYNFTNFTPQLAASYFKGGVTAFLQALDSRGLGKILAEPNLVVRSGEKGEFLAGARIPVQQVTGTGSTATVSISYEEVGVKLNFAPVVLDNGLINLKIDPAEVSSISQYVSIGGFAVPQIDTRTVSTSVDLREGESLILAGMLSEEAKRNMQKIPLLGDIPILGALFRSTSDELTQTELAFFITPTLVRALPAGSPSPELPGEKQLSTREDRALSWIPIPGGSDEPMEKPEQKHATTSMETGK